MTIGNGVTSIGHVAFGNCWSVSSLTIGTSVRSIGSGAFTHCRQLARAVIPDSVTSIESGAFSNCDKLVDVTIGTSVTSIGDAAFSSCRELTSATFRGNAPASFGEFVFLVTSPLFAVYYYEGSTGFTSPTWQGYNAVALQAPVTPPLETWRKQHFGAQATNTGEAADIADPDGDGLTNRQEFAAGTDPKSGASTLKVKNAILDGGTFTVIVDALPSRVYELQRLIPAPEATWQFAAAVGPFDTAGTVALTDQSASADTALYRVMCQFNP